MKQKLYEWVSWTDEECKDRSIMYHLQLLKDEIVRFNERYGTRFKPHETAIEYLEKSND